ncbi:MAG: DNA primase [Patescibacteria group bacterium]
MNDQVEEIKKRIDVVDLISNYLTLKKAGVNYRAVCPFHNEKTPSLMISPEKQIWHCFGCSEGGDIITFIMKMENLEFPEALKMLADRAGVILKRRTQDEISQVQPDKKSRLFTVNAFAAKVFNKILITHPAGKIALEYLKKRKLTDLTIKEFMIGYGPSSRAMMQLLKKHGFSDQELQGAGNPDKFYKRIIFPIRDVMGNTIAFTGRVLDSNQEPKYLNTPETVIFHKSRVLYNLEKARGAIRTEKATVVVEGQMDVIASWQSGVKNVVATSGTALTPDHLQILYRYSPNIIFAFDSDTAGLTSAKKAYEMAISESFNVKMVTLGEFKDPGEMIAEDPKLWLEAVKNARSIIDWYFELALKNHPSGLEATDKKEIAKEVLPILKKIPDTIEQAHYVGLLAKKLAVSEQIIFDALTKVTPEKSKKQKEITQEKKPKISAQELLLSILFKNPVKIKEAGKALQAEDFQDTDLKMIYNYLLEWYNKNNQRTDIQLTEKELKESLRKDLNRQLQIKIDELILITNEQVDDDLMEDWQVVLEKVQSDKKEALKDYYSQEIKKAEISNDLERLKKLIKEFQDAISK